MGCAVTFQWCVPYVAFTCTSAMNVQHQVCRQATQDAALQCRWPVGVLLALHPTAFLDGPVCMGWHVTLVLEDVAAVIPDAVQLLQLQGGRRLCTVKKKV